MIVIEHAHSCAILFRDPERPRYFRLGCALVIAPTRLDTHSDGNSIVCVGLGAHGLSAHPTG